MNQLDQILSQHAYGPVHYERDQNWQQQGVSTAAERYTLLSPNILSANINGVGYALTAQKAIDLSQAASWDTQAPTDYTQAANRAGKDFFVYACQPASGIAPVILLSANSTYPSGYGPSTSRKIAGFHCLCMGTGTDTAGVTAPLPNTHALYNFGTGDILPASVWDLNFLPKTCAPQGMVYCAALGLWVDIYPQSGTGSSTASTFGSTHTVNRNWMDFCDDLGAVGKRLLSDLEFQLAASGGNEQTNIAGSSDPGTVGGHVDTAGRRMISNIGCEDMTGVIWQWLTDQSFRYDLGTPSYSDAGNGINVTHTASPGGAQVFVKFLQDGTPYLCSNLATSADVYLTFGSYIVPLRYDASANTGLPVYFNYSAGANVRFLFNNTLFEKNTHILASDPAYLLFMTHDANAASDGVALYYNTATTRFEANCAADAAQALSQAGPAWNYYGLPGSKGQFYGEGGNYGDVKLLAGGAWNDGALCGSRARHAYYARWSAFTSLGGRGRAEART